MSQYLVNVVTQFSVMFNVLTGGRPYQTFSARSWHDKRKGRPNAVFLIDFFFGVILHRLLTCVGYCDKNKNLQNHCMEAWILWSCRKAAMGQLNDEAKNAEHRSVDLLERQLSLVRKSEYFVQQFEADHKSHRLDKRQGRATKIQKKTA